MPKRDKSPARRSKLVDSPKSVWSVFEGEDYEGGHTWATFSNKEAAVLCAKARMQEQGPRNWVEEEPGERWEDGCDYIEIQEHLVWRSCEEFSADLEKQLKELRERQTQTKE